MPWRCVYLDEADLGSPSWLLDYPATGCMRIVETRQRASPDARGILLPWADPAHLELVRLAPSPDLASFVHRHWRLTWDLRGHGPHEQRVAGFPCVDFVFEPTGPRVYGVTTGARAHRFEGRGRVFATKLRPGAWPALSRTPAAELTDRSIPIGAIFPTALCDQVAAVATSTDDGECLRAVEGFIRACEPRIDDTMNLVSEMVAYINAFPQTARVAHVCRAFDLTERQAQRLFRLYVGVGMKWLMLRARLHEAIERVRLGRAGSAALAHELGYYDQAQFIREFRRLTGRSPGRYARSR